MEALHETVQNQTIQLSSLDAQSTSIAISYVFIYENAKSSKDFMHTQRLADSLYVTLERFPVFLGHLVEKQYGLDQVVVDRDNLNSPVFEESSSNVCYEDIRMASFHWSSWKACLPRSLSLVVTPDDRGSVKLLQVHIARLGNNSGVVMAVSTLHSLMDGYGFFRFINDWARTCAMGSDAPLASYSFDRNIIEQNLPKLGKPIDPVSLRMYAKFNAVAEWMAWTSNATRGWMIKRGIEAADGEGHFFKVTGESLDRLRNSVKQFVAGRVSDNDLLASLASHAIAKGLKDVESSTGKGILGTISSALSTLVGQVPGNLHANVVCDARHRIGIADKNFIGNGLVSPVAEIPLDKLEVAMTDRDLAEITRVIRSLVDNVDGEYVRGYLDVWKQHPTAFARALVALGSDSRFISITNQTRFGSYDADFGSGRPTWACPAPTLVPNIIFILSSPDSHRDAIVYITANKPAMQNILKNSYWMNIAELIN
ncbi:hypothetical protein EC988_000788 [Linderina pennispora]|nr:hypothetical protein EC988_000788 [Linderina pennispora]